MEHRLLELNEGGQKFIDRVSNPTTFKTYMLVKAPVLGVTGAYLENLATHGSRMVLPFSRRTKDLFGNVFTAALLAGAEIASASMLVLHIRNQSAPLTAKLKKTSIEAHGDVDGDVKVLCHEGLHYAQFVEKAAESGAHAEHTFRATIVDADGEITHEIELTWQLGPKT